MLAIDRRSFVEARRHLAQSIDAYQGKRIVTPADSASGWSLNTAAEGLLLVREGRPREGAALLRALLATGVRQGSVRGQARANPYPGEAYRAPGDGPPAPAAFARLGAKQAGVLGKHQLMPDGQYRDTVVFSILNSEWPAVKTQLRWNQRRHNSGTAS